MHRVWMEHAALQSIHPRFEIISESSNYVVAWEKKNALCNVIGRLAGGGIYNKTMNQSNHIQSSLIQTQVARGSGGFCPGVR